MPSFFSKVLRRKRDDKEGTSPQQGSEGELLGGRFEDISPTVSPSMANFPELKGNGELRGRNREKTTQKDHALRTFFRSKSRARSPPKLSTTVEEVPKLPLNLLAEVKVANSGLDASEPLLSEATIGAQRLTPVEVLSLVRTCSQAITLRGIDALGIMHPHWYSASQEVQRNLISLFIHSLTATSPLSSSSFESEINSTRSPHDIAAVLRWALRHISLEGGSFGTDSDWYSTFLDAERKAEYPPKAFSDILQPLVPGPHLDLLKQVLEIFSSFASHAETNSTSGSKLSKIFGLWLLNSHRVETQDDWRSFYDRWEAAGRQLEHLFFAHIRNEAADHQIPLRLVELVQKYPYYQFNASPTTDLQLLPRPKFTTRLYGALFIRVETELPNASLRPSRKIHPLRVVAEALSSSGEASELASLWTKVVDASKAEGSGSPLTRIFTDDTIRFLTMVPDDDGDDSIMSPIVTLLPPSPGTSKDKRLSFSLSEFTGELKRTASSQTQQETPLSASSTDWSVFSSAGFSTTSPLTPLASTLFSSDVERTSPATTSRRASRYGKSPSSTSIPRKSIEIVEPPTAPPPRAPEESVKVTSKLASFQIVQIDEAFLDFWSDALLDPVSSNWPSFVICKVKPVLSSSLTYGDEGNQKTVQWLVLEQVFTVKPPPPRAPSPEPTEAQERGQTFERPSSPSSLSKKRFAFWSTSRSNSVSSVLSLSKNKKDKEPRVGEMGELAEEEGQEKPAASRTSTSTAVKRKDKKEKDVVRVRVPSPKPRKSTEVPRKSIDASVVASKAVSPPVNQAKVEETKDEAPSAGEEKAGGQEQVDESKDTAVATAAVVGVVAAAAAPSVLQATTQEETETSALPTVEEADKEPAPASAIEGGTKEDEPKDDVVASAAVGELKEEASPAVETEEVLAPSATEEHTKEVAAPVIPAAKADVEVEEVAQDVTPTPAVVETETKDELGPTVALALPVEEPIASTAQEQEPELAVAVVDPPQAVEAQVIEVPVSKEPSLPVESATGPALVDIPVIPEQPADFIPAVEEAVLSATQHQLAIQDESPPEGVIGGSATDSEAPNGGDAVEVVVPAVIDAEDAASPVVPPGLEQSPDETPAPIVPNLEAISSHEESPLAVDTPAPPSEDSKSLNGVQTEEEKVVPSVEDISTSPKTEESPNEPEVVSPASTVVPLEPAVSRISIVVPLDPHENFVEIVHQIVEVEKIVPPPEIVEAARDGPVDSTDDSSPVVEIIHQILPVEKVQTPPEIVEAVQEQGGTPPTSHVNTPSVVEMSEAESQPTLLEPTAQTEEDTLNAPVEGSIPVDATVGPESIAAQPTDEASPTRGGEELASESAPEAEELIASTAEEKILQAVQDTGTDLPPSGVGQEAGVEPRDSEETNAKEIVADHHADDASKTGKVDAVPDVPAVLEDETIATAASTVGNEPIEELNVPEVKAEPVQSGTVAVEEGQVTRGSPSEEGLTEGPEPKEEESKAQDDKESIPKEIAESSQAIEAKPSPTEESAQDVASLAPAAELPTVVTESNTVDESTALETHPEGPIPAPTAEVDDSIVQAKPLTEADEPTEEVSLVPEASGDLVEVTSEATSAKIPEPEPELDGVIPPAPADATVAEDRAYSQVDEIQVEPKPPVDDAVVAIEVPTAVEGVTKVEQTADVPITVESAEVVDASLKDESYAQADTIDAAPKPPIDDAAVAEEEPTAVEGITKVEEEAGVPITVESTGVVETSLKDESYAQVDDIDVEAKPPVDDAVVAEEVPTAEEGVTKVEENAGVPITVENVDVVEAGLDDSGEGQEDLPAAPTIDETSAVSDKPQTNVDASECSALADESPAAEEEETLIDAGEDARVGKIEEGPASETEVSPAQDQAVEENTGVVSGESAITPAAEEKDIPAIGEQVEVPFAEVKEVVAVMEPEIRSITVASEEGPSAVQEEDKVAIEEAGQASPTTQVTPVPQEQQQDTNAAEGSEPLLSAVETKDSEAEEAGIKENDAIPASEEQRVSITPVKHEDPVAEEKAVLRAIENKVGSTAESDAAPAVTDDDTPILDVSDGPSAVQEDVPVPNEQGVIVAEEKPGDMGELASGVVDENREEEGQDVAAVVERDTQTVKEGEESVGVKDGGHGTVVQSPETTAADVAVDEELLQTQPAAEEAQVKSSTLLDPEISVPGDSQVAEESIPEQDTNLKGESEPKLASADDVTSITDNADPTQDGPDPASSVNDNNTIDNLPSMQEIATGSPSIPSLNVIASATPRIAPLNLGDDTPGDDAVDLDPVPVIDAPVLPPSSSASAAFPNLAKPVYETVPVEALSPREELTSFSLSENQPEPVKEVASDSVQLEDNQELLSSLATAASTSDLPSAIEHIVQAGLTPSAEALLDAVQESVIGKIREEDAASPGPTSPSQDELAEEESLSTEQSDVVAGHATEASAASEITLVSPGDPDGTHTRSETLQDEEPLVSKADVSAIVAQDPPLDKLAPELSAPAVSEAKDEEKHAVDADVSSTLATSGTS